MKRLISGILIAAAAFVFASATAQANETTMTADELRTVLAGKTWSVKGQKGSSAKAIIKEDGSLTIMQGVKKTVGTWKIKGDGTWCRTLWGKNKCQNMKRSGDDIKVYELNGKHSSTLSLQ